MSTLARLDALYGRLCWHLGRALGNWNDRRHPWADRAAEKPRSFHVLDAIASELYAGSQRRAYRRTHRVPRSRRRRARRTP